MANYMLSVEDVKTVVNILRPEILQTPALLNADVLKMLRINLLTGIQFQDSQIINVRKGGTTRRYAERDLLEDGSQAGRLVERKLEVELSMNRYPDNIQNYREKEPFRLNPDNTFEAPNTRAAIDAILANYAEDIFANLFHGKKGGSNKALSLYDGIYTHIQNYVNKGEIKVVPGANIVIGGTDKAANWHAFKDWYNSLPTRLRAAKELIVMATDEAKAEILEGYIREYIHLASTNDIDKPGFRFVTMENVTLVSNPVMGKGSFLVATLPENIDFGVDSLNNQAQVFVSQNYKDLNEFMYQIQSAQGVRIRMLDAGSICVNDADMNKPITDIQGAEMDAPLTVVFDPTKGKVTSSVADMSNLKAGTSVTLTAQPEVGYKVSTWSDGVTDAQRTVITDGFPTQLSVLFEPSE